MENNILELKPFIRMGALKLKQEIVESLDNLSEKYLKAVHALIKGLEEVGNIEEDIPMNPIYEGMTEEDIKHRLDESRKQYENGEIHTMEEVRNMIKAKK